MYSCHILCHVHVINIITYCNHVPYYDINTTLTLICLQHCLHYAPYNGTATVDAYLFLAFPDLTCHLKDARIGVF